MRITTAAGVNNLKKEQDYYYIRGKRNTKFSKQTRLHFESNKRTVIKQEE